MNSAINAVATISKLLRRDAFAAVVNFSPNKRHIGAAISSKIIASVNGNSFKVSLFSEFLSPLAFRTRAITPIPNPAPKYKNPAISVGGIYPKRILESGELSA